MELWTEHNVELRVWVRAHLLDMWSYTKLICLAQPSQGQSQSANSKQQYSAWHQKSWLSRHMTNQCSQFLATVACGCFTVVFWWQTLEKIYPKICLKYVLLKIASDAYFSLTYLFRTFLNKDDGGTTIFVENFPLDVLRSHSNQHFFVLPSPGPIPSPYWAEMHQFHPAVSSGDQGEWPANTKQRKEHC